MMLAKLAISGLLKLKYFENVGHGVIISVHGVNNKVLSRQSNSTLDVFKFGNSSISMWEDIIIPIYQGFD